MPHMPSLCATYYGQGQRTYIQSFCIFEKYSMFMKIRPVGADLFHADRRTDMTKLIAAFRDFSNAPKNFRPTAR